MKEIREKLTNFLKIEGGRDLRSWKQQYTAPKHILLLRPYT